MCHCPSPTTSRIAILSGVLLGLCAVGAQAGNLDAPAAPADASSAMHTLEDVYNPPGCTQL